MGQGLRKLLSWVGVLALVAAALGFAAGADRRRDACVAVGLCKQTDFMAAMLVSVQRQQKLLVLTARLVVPVTSARDTTLGPMTVATTKQTAILPATVNYVLDLAALQASDLVWDAATQTLTVRRPAVVPMAPAIEWQKAQIYQDGGWATALTRVSDTLRQDNQQKAPGLFLKQSKDADLLALADTAADSALQTAFGMPLVAAGFPDARVIVTR